MFNNDTAESTFLYELARDSETSEIVGYMKNSDDPVIRARAAEILGDFAELPRQFQEAEINRELVNTALNDDNVRVRAMAIDALYRHGEGGLERLIDELSDRDIGAAPDWVIAETLIEWLNSDHAEFRLVGATALADYGGEHVVDDLIERFEDPDARVRQRAIRTAGLLGDGRCVEPLKERLEDPRGMVRTEAATALANLGSDAALEALIPVARANDEELRHIAVDALGGFANLKPLVVLIKALEDRSGRVQRTAAVSLIELFATTPGDRAEEIRHTVATQLERVDPDAILPTLVDLCEESRRWRVRRNAIWLLGELATESHDEAVIDCLIAALETDDMLPAQLATAALIDLDERFEGEKLDKKLRLYILDERSSSLGEKRAQFVLDQISPDIEREVVNTGVDYTYVREPADYTRKKRNEES